MYYISNLDEENWGGKNPPIKLVKKSRRSNRSMLEPNIEICSGIMLLKNGWASHGNVSVQTSHTCAFDSLYFAVAAMYADYGHVKSQIDELAPTCAFSEMVATMFETFGTIAVKFNSLHRQRNKILHSIFEPNKLEFDCGLILIDCASNVNYIIPKALQTSLYSYSRTKRCSKCDREIVSNRCFVDIHFEQYQKRSIQNLNGCLLDTLLSEQSSSCSCGGPQIISETVFSNFIMIDLHLKSTIKEIALNDIPKNLNILGEHFALTACIEFIGETPEDFNLSDNSVAHYISHILRSNNQWQTYDDLKSHVSPSKINTQIKGQVLFYVKI